MKHRGPHGQKAAFLRVQSVFHPWLNSGVSGEVLLRGEAAGDVFAEDGANGGFAIAAAGEGGAAGTLQLNVAAAAVDVDDFTEENGAAVAELGNEVAELVAGIGLGENVGAFGGPVAGEGFGGGGGVHFELEFGGEGFVEFDETGLANLGGFGGGVETGEETPVGVVEGGFHGVQLPV